MKLEALASALETELGFSVASVGELHFERAVSARAQALRRSLSDYVLLALQESSELAALLGALAVDESWLWRDPEQLEQLRLELEARCSAPVLEVLCAPCARGEEAWSLAALCHAQGLRAPACRITAVDLSEAAIVQARSGRYPRSAWRETRALPWWLQAQGEELVVDPILRPMLRFECANLLRWPAPGYGFDLLFSRNFLIYLGPQARQQWLQQLLAMAQPGASFWTARSEVLSQLDPRLASFGEGAWRLQAAKAEPAIALPRTNQPATPPAKWRSASKPAVMPIASAPVMATAGTRSGPGTRLEQALQAIAADQLQSAETLLRELLYLEHGHEEALMHLAALRLRQGDAAEADRLHARLARLHKVHA